MKRLMLGTVLVAAMAAGACGDMQSMTSPTATTIHVANEETVVIQDSAAPVSHPEDSTVAILD